MTSVVPTNPTSREIAVLVDCIRHGSVKDTATSLGIAEQTVKSHLGALYRKLGVGSRMEAAVALGWVHIPTDREVCGWTGTCSRAGGHRGHHGGFRGLGQGRVR